MPRKRRLIGPRKKMNIAALRQLSHEERLNILIRSVVECGGTSEQDDSEPFRRLLGDARTKSPPPQQTPGRCDFRGRCLSAAHAPGEAHGRHLTDSPFQLRTKKPSCIATVGQSLRGLRAARKGKAPPASVAVVST